MEDSTRDYPKVVFKQLKGTCPKCGQLWSVCKQLNCPDPAKLKDGAKTKPNFREPGGNRPKLPTLRELVKEHKEMADAGGDAMPLEEFVYHKIVSATSAR